MSTNSNLSGGGGGSTVNTVDTFDYERVCADGSPAFRQIVRDDAGVETETFFDETGAITPTNWYPGECRYTYEQHMEGLNLSIAGTWVRPANTSSVTVMVRHQDNPTNEVKIEDADNQVWDIFEGDVFTWSAGNGEILSGTFEVQVNANDYVQIIWTERIPL